jgi:hypothetical protein
VALWPKSWDSKLDGMGWSFDGIGLAVDSAASLEVTALPGLHRRSGD